MMDELELLKKDWQKQEQGLPKLSYDQIYKMIWKKSSSLVKWIFYISIVEFLFWITISFIPLGNKGVDLPEANFILIINRVLTITQFVIIIYFMFQFYQNYKKISVTDSARDLMKKIIATRKTVMRYVWFNLGLFAVTMIIVFTEVLVLNPPPELAERIANSDSSLLVWLALGVGLLAAIMFFGLLIWLFYRLLYGLLLKRLTLNYKELKRLEV